jgi:hypothetical protein
MRTFLSTLLLVAAAAQAVKSTETVRCTVQADSILASPRFTPLRLFDGDITDPESRWASSRSPEPHWVSCTFARPISIDRVVIHSHTEPDLVLRAAAIQVHEAGTWRTVASVEANDRTPVEFSFPPCETETFRLWITDACRRDSTVRLFEIELFAGGQPIKPAISQPALVTRSRIDDQTLLDSVYPLPDSLFPVPDEDDRNRGLLAAYARAMARWGEVLAERIEPVPDRPGQAFYGLGGNGEDDVRPIGYAVMVNGLLWRMPTTSTVSNSSPTAENRADSEQSSRGRADRYRADALAALRYLTASHVTGPSTCLNGKKWGNAWQSAMWTRAAGVGAWALWNELDRKLQLAAARMIEHEADRFLDQSPKSSVARDTGAEENAWNALILSLATSMMPRHPRAAAWDCAAKRYLYNVFSVPADAQDASPGDDGRAINAWVTTVNAHADFTVENHGLVHIGYQKTSVAQLLENAVHYLAVGRQPPAACRHHVSEASELLYQCAGWDGAPVYFGGNDWKIVHTQPTDLPIYAVLSIVAGDRRAALQEQRGLEWVARLQAAEDGFFNVRRDLEYGGACATRLAACYLAHAAAGPGTEPLPADQFDQQMTGIRHLEGGRAMLHRSAEKFASFAFGPKWLALTLPSGPDRTVWPHFASCLGLIDGEAPTEKQAEQIRLSPPPYSDGFWVVGRLNRCGGKIRHDFAFISPAAGVTVYVQRLRCQEGFQPVTCETGIVGHEYDIGSNHRTLFGRFGTLALQGTGGEEKTHELATDWLNLGNRVGYVVKRFPESNNVVRYHDLTGGTGRVPKLQEWFSLIGNTDEPLSSKVQWACIVTYPNRSAEETERLPEGVQFLAEADAATVSFVPSAGNRLETYRVDLRDANVVSAGH